MSSWTKHIGFPVLEFDAKQNKLEQHRFLSSGDVKPEEDEHIWHIPLTAEAAGGGAGGGAGGDVSRLVMTTRTLQDPFKALGVPESSKLNSKFMAMFRVAYTDSQFLEFANAAGSGQMGVTDAMNVLSDVAALNTAGRMSVAVRCSIDCVSSLMPLSLAFSLVLPGRPTWSATSACPRPLGTTWACGNWLTKTSSPWYPCLRIPPSTQS